MRALRFNLQNRARVIESLGVFDDLFVEVGVSESLGLTFTVRCCGYRSTFTADVLSKIPCNWNYSIYSEYDIEDDRCCPVLFCFENVA